MSDFESCLWVVTEHQVGTPIFVVAACGGEDQFKLLALPTGVTRLPPVLEVKLVGLIARSHYRRNNGEIACFGKILGYTYLRSPRERWTLSKDGHLVNRHGEPIQKGKYSLSLKRQPHRDIAFLFRRRLGNDRQID